MQQYFIRLSRWLWEKNQWVECSQERLDNLASGASQSQAQYPAWLNRGFLPSTLNDEKQTWIESLRKNHIRFESTCYLPHWLRGQDHERTARAATSCANSLRRNGHVEKTLSSHARNLCARDGSWKLHLWWWFMLPIALHGLFHTNCWRFQLLCALCQLGPPRVHGDGLIFCLCVNIFVAKSSQLAPDAGRKVWVLPVSAQGTQGRRVFPTHNEDCGRRMLIRSNWQWKTCYGGAGRVSVSGQASLNCPMDVHVFPSFALRGFSCHQENGNFALLCHAGCEYRWRAIGVGGL